MKHFGDITKISGYEVPAVDIICGGSPCQDLSVAGKRAGLAGQRSGLFMEQIRIIKEMRENGRTNELIRPRFMVWENVPGAFSSNNGEDFRAVLEETARIADENAVIPELEKGQKWTPSGCIMGDGWSIAWRVHDAQFWGVPQRRKRIALVADFGGESAPEILFERKGMSGDIEASRTQREEIADTTRTGVMQTSGFPLGFRPENVRLYDEKATTVCNGTRPGFTCGVVQGQVWDGTQISPTLTANNANGSQRMPDKENFNAIITYGLDRASYNQGQNAKYNFSIEEELIGAQVARGPGAVCQSAVRRLTPLECERLQGYPDRWTDIGDWTDSKGKTHKGDADSPRYKALGNSIALPFWRWMAKRMVGYIDGKPTMASLFDGIGGFPLVFSRCGCEPVWASEIEEFPIAVTKKRFPDYGQASKE